MYINKRKVEETLEEKKIIFIHIPKAGGRTLLAFLNQNYHDRVISDLHNKSYEELSGFSDDFIDKYSVFAGHFSLGLHKYIKNSEYITILREPVDRVISLYYYIKESQNHFHHDNAIKYNLEEYVQLQSSYASVSNFQTRILSSSDIFNYEKEIDDSIFDRAKDNICKFLLAGTLEDFGLFILLLKSKLGLNMPGYEKRNITKSRPKIAEVTDNVKEIITKLNYYDIKLYDFVRNEFFRKVFEESKIINTEIQNLNFQINELIKNKEIKLRNLSVENILKII